MIQIVPEPGLECSRMSRLDCVSEWPRNMLGYVFRNVQEHIPKCPRNMCSAISWNMFRHVSERVPECPKTVGEYHGTYSGIFWNNYASECSTMSSRMSLKRLGIVWDVPECSGTFSGMS